MTWKLPIVFASLAVFLVACPAAEAPGPGPNPGPPPGQTVTQVGLIAFAETGAGSSGAPAGSGFASFYEVSATPAGDFSVARGDVCTVFQGTEPPPSEQPSTTYLDAGAALTATAGSETYAVLTKQEDAESIFYASDFNESLPPLPESALTVVAPGAAFPAFTAAAPPAPDALELTSPAGLSAVGPASTFGWTPAPVAGADIYVFFYAAQPLDEGRVAGVYCQLEDDGAFSFSAATQADMQAAGLSAGTLSFGGRSSTRLQVEGGAALVLTTSRNTVYTASASAAGHLERLRGPLDR